MFQRYSLTRRRNGRFTCGPNPQRKDVRRRPRATERLTVREEAWASNRRSDLGSERGRRWGRYLPESRWASSWERWSLRFSGRRTPSGSRTCEPRSGRARGRQRTPSWKATRGRQKSRRLRRRLRRRRKLPDAVFLSRDTAPSPPQLAWAGHPYAAGPDPNGPCQGRRGLPEDFVGSRRGDMIDGPIGRSIQSGKQHFRFGRPANHPTRPKDEPFMRLPEFGFHGKSRWLEKLSQARGLREVTSRGGGCERQV